MKEKFQRFIAYLTVAGVFFAIFYSFTPAFAEKYLNPLMPFLGPLILIALGWLAWRKKPQDETPTTKKPPDIDAK
jgi:arginine exporter protein ArgO